MSKEKPKFKDFELPTKILDKLYELTGKGGAYKGFIIAYSTENGEPVIHSKCDTQLTEYGLHKALETFITDFDNSPYPIEEDQENT
jgi:hypothetical protein